MNNVRQLIIRACKSKNPEQRLFSVYKRFYYTFPKGEEDQAKMCLIGILASVCDEYVSIKPSEMVSLLDPDDWRYKSFETYPDRVFQILLDKIRLAHRDAFRDELTIPARFRWARHEGTAR